MNRLVRVPVWLVLTALVVTCMAIPPGDAAAQAAKPTKLTLAESTKLLAVGQAYTARVKAATPARASRAVTWTSSNRRVATVAPSGRVTALRVGTTTIRATSKASTRVTAKLVLTVSVRPTGLTLTSTGTTLAVGQTYTARVKAATPARASRAVTWTSSNRRVATVTGKGVVRAIRAGAATITARSVLNPRVRRTITVTVSATATTPGATPPSGPTAPTGPTPPATPEPPPVIDPQLVGRWSLFITNAGSTDIYEADGTWARIIIFKGPISPYQQYSKGRYRAEGGKIYYSDIIYQSRNTDSDPWSPWQPAANPDRVENYAIRSDEHGEYLVTEDDPAPVTDDSVKYYRDTD